MRFRVRALRFPGNDNGRGGMSGLLALLDDVAGIAKIAASSVDDVASQAFKAGSKAAGAVIDDADGGLVLPHPRLHDRPFVLAPLAEIAPGWRHPVSGRTATALLAACPSDQIARPLP